MFNCGNIGDHVYYPKGMNIFMQGSFSDFLYLLSRGTVKLVYYLTSGEQKILSFITAQSIIDATSFFLNTKHYITSIAHTNCEIIILNKNMTNELIINNSQFNNLLIRSLAKEVKSLGSYIVSSSLPSTTLRVASVLLQLSYQFYAKENNAIVFDITQEELASLTSLSRVSVSNSLAFLDKIKIINRSRKRIIFQRETLKTWLLKNL